MSDSTSPSPSAPHPLEVFAEFLQGVAQFVNATVAVAQEVYTHRIVEASGQVESPPLPDTGHINIIPPEAKTFGTALGNFLFGVHAAVIEFAESPTERGIVQENPRRLLEAGRQAASPPPPPTSTIIPPDATTFGRAVGNFFVGVHVAVLQFAKSPAAHWIAEVKVNADARGESVHDYLERQCFHYGCHLAVRGMHEEKDFGAVEILAQDMLSLELRQGEGFCLGSALVEAPWQAAQDPAETLRNFVLRARRHPTDDPRSHDYEMRPPRFPSLGVTAEFISLETGRSELKNEEASDALHPGDIAGPSTEHHIAQNEQLEHVRAAMKKKLTPQAYSLWEEHQQGCSYAEAARRLGMSDKERERYRREITRKTKSVQKRVRNSTR